MLPFLCARFGVAFAVVKLPNVSIHHNLQVEINFSWDMYMYKVYKHLNVHPASNLTKVLLALIWPRVRMEPLCLWVIVGITHDWSALFFIQCVVYIYYIYHVSNYVDNLLSSCSPVVLVRLTYIIGSDATSMLRSSCLVLFPSSRLAFAFPNFSVTNLTECHLVLRHFLESCCNTHPAFTVFCRFLWERRGWDWRTPTRPPSPSAVHSRPHPPLHEWKCPLNPGSHYQPSVYAFNSYFYHFSLDVIASCLISQHLQPPMPCSSPLGPVGGVAARLRLPRFRVRAPHLGQSPSTSTTCSLSNRSR